MTIVSFSAHIRIVDRLKLFQTAANMGLEGTPTFARVAATVVLNPEVAPVTTGFEYLPGTEGHRTGENDFRIDAIIHIQDVDGLISEACKCYETRHHDDTWRPTSLAEAAYQVTVESNANENPAVCGYEVVSVQFSRDADIDYSSGPRI
jgi:hypothetical protein